MPTWDFAIWIGIALIATGLLLRRCQRQFHRNRLIEDMPTSRIRSASQGYTELVGIAKQGDHPRIAPLSSELCLWWRYTIEKYQSNGKSSHWVTVEKKHSPAPFFMDDTTGSCRVEPNNAEISCRHRRIWYGNTRRPIGAAPAKSTSSIFTLSIGQRY